MKKLVVIILALMVLAGTAVPCCIYDDCQNDLTNTASNHAPIEKGACSPFSNCASCAGFVQMAKHINVQEPTVEQPSHHEQMVVFPVSVYASSLFQPPRCG